jgi:hypothetical protein
MGLFKRVNLVFVLSLILLASCSPTAHNSADYPESDRRAALPADIQKQNPSTDPYPPILHSNDYETPVPVPGGVNTSGGEDSAFILPDGQTLYFFFTPDVRLPVEEQITDGVTGLYVSHKQGEAWSEAERVWLAPPGTLSMDGAVSIQGDEMWFASAREGYTGVQIFTAEWVDGRWQNWQEVGSRLMDEVMIGEVEIYGDDLYFHSDRPGGKGGYDIWMTTRDGESWSNPVNIAAVNTAGMEGWPHISPDGSELWFTRTVNGTPAIFYSRRQGDSWGEPEMILSQFAGESSVDAEGNIYFTHHYFDDGEMVEGDIYVAYKKK